MANTRLWRIRALEVGLNCVSEGKVYFGRRELLGMSVSTFESFTRIVVLTEDKTGPS